MTSEFHRNDQNGRKNGRSGIWIWETAGALFIISSGCLLHFVFEWFGRWPPLALVAAVNESVWEHLKLAFWPSLFFGLFARPFLKGKTDHYWTAKIAGILLMPIFIAVSFYAYILVFKRHNLIYDISIFVIAVILGQMTSARLMQKTHFTRLIKITAALLLIAVILMFSLCTYCPPRLPLFHDGRTGGYGIS